MSDPDGCLTAVSVALMAIILSFALGDGCGSKRVRDEAIGAGAAHYECDPQTGKTEFKWRELKGTER
jgi:hypothetical protein